MFRRAKFHSDLYGTNLNELFNYFSYEVPANGFALGTKGHDADKVYGLISKRKIAKVVLLMQQTKFGHFAQTLKVQ